MTKQKKIGINTRKQALQFRQEAFEAETEMKKDALDVEMHQIELQENQVNKQMELFKALINKQTQLFCCLQVKFLSMLNDLAFHLFTYSTTIQVT